MPDVVGLLLLVVANEDLVLQGLEGIDHRIERLVVDLDLLDPVDAPALAPDLVDLCEWIADYYDQSSYTKAPPSGVAIDPVTDAIG